MKRCSAAARVSRSICLAWPTGRRFSITPYHTHPIPFHPIPSHPPPTTPRRTHARAPSHCSAAAAGSASPAATCWCACCFGGRGLIERRIGQLIEPPKTKPRVHRGHRGIAALGFGVDSRERVVVASAPSTPTADDGKKKGPSQPSRVGPSRGPGVKKPRRGRFRPRDAPARTRKGWGGVVKSGSSDQGAGQLAAQFLGLLARCSLLLVRARSGRHRSDESNFWRGIRSESNMSDEQDSESHLNHKRQRHGIQISIPNHKLRVQWNLDSDSALELSGGPNQARNPNRKC